MVSSNPKTTSALLSVGLFVCILTFVTSTGVRCPDEVSEGCPEKDPEQPVYFPMPDDCSKFCECSQGYAFEVDCPDGLLYDDKIHVCSWPDQVNCGNRPIPKVLTRA